MSDDEKVKPAEPMHKIEVTGSTNTAIISGDRNVVTQNFTPVAPAAQFVELPPDDGNLLWIRVGKRIMLKLFGTLDHSMKAYGLITTALGLGILVPIFGDTLRTIQTFQNVFGTMNFQWALGGLLFLDVSILYVGPVVAIISWRTTCPECDWRFSYLRTKRLLDSHVVVSDQAYTKTSNTYTCSNPSCRHTEENVTEFDRRPISQSL